MCKVRAKDSIANIHVGTLILSIKYDVGYLGMIRVC